ncbi:MAG: hypothetical protein U0175_02500 [Caldilineaceae bacterium]
MLHNNSNITLISVVLVLMTAVISGSCSQASIPFESPLPTPVIEPGWYRVNVPDRFSFYLPPGMQMIPVMGVDSIVGQYNSDTLELSFDYGWYSGSVSMPDKPEYKEVWTEIDHAQAQVVTFHDAGSGQHFKYVAAIYFPQPRPETESTKGDKLNIWVFCKTPNEQEVALQIFQTIKFVH